MTLKQNTGTMMTDNQALLNEIIEKYMVIAQRQKEQYEQTGAKEYCKLQDSTGS